MNFLSSISKTLFHTKAWVPVSSRMSSNCVFCKIVTKETPSNILHEVGSHRLEILATNLTPFLQDDQFLVFPDISPAAEHHLLVIPKVTDDIYQKYSSFIICIGAHCRHPILDICWHPPCAVHGEGWPECAGEGRWWPQHLPDWLPLASPPGVSPPHACHLSSGGRLGQEDYVF